MPAGISVAALHLLPESFWATNRTSSWLCPFLFSKAPESQLTWKCVEFECQGISIFTEPFKINISSSVTAITLYLRILIFLLISKRGPDQTFLLTIIVISLKPNGTAHSETAPRKQRFCWPGAGGCQRKLSTV